VGQDGNHIVLIWGSGKQKYFFKQGWTAKSPTSPADLPVGQNSSSQHERSEMRVPREENNPDVASLIRATLANHSVGYAC
jgi:hypothetical protein